MGFQAVSDFGGMIDFERFHTRAESVETERGDAERREFDGDQTAIAAERYRFDGSEIAHFVDFRRFANGDGQFESSGVRNIVGQGEICCGITRHRAHGDASRIARCDRGAGGGVGKRTDDLGQVREVWFAARDRGDARQEPGRVQARQGVTGPLVQARAVVAQRGGQTNRAERIKRVVMRRFDQQSASFGGAGDLPIEFGADGEVVFESVGGGSGDAKKDGRLGGIGEGPSFEVESEGFPDGIGGRSGQVGGASLVAERSVVERRSGEREGRGRFGAMEGLGQFLVEQADLLAAPGSPRNAARGGNETLAGGESAEIDVVLAGDFAGRVAVEGLADETGEGRVVESRAKTSGQVRRRRVELRRRRVSLRNRERRRSSAWPACADVGMKRLILGTVGAAESIDANETSTQRLARIDRRKAGQIAVATGFNPNGDASTMENSRDDRRLIGTERILDDLTGQGRAIDRIGEALGQDDEVRAAVFEIIGEMTCESERIVDPLGDAAEAVERVEPVQEQADRSSPGLVDRSEFGGRFEFGEFGQFDRSQPSGTVEAAVGDDQRRFGDGGPNDPGEDGRMTFVEDRRRACASVESEPGATRKSAPARSSRRRARRAGRRRP